MTFANGRTEIDFVDSYKYSLAAYKVAELLGLDNMMPVTVERVWNMKSGALSWWVDVRWDEGQRLKQHLWSRPTPKPGISRCTGCASSPRSLPTPIATSATC